MTKVRHTPQSLTQQKRGCRQVRSLEEDFVASAGEGEHADTSPGLVVRLDRGEKATVEVDVGKACTNGHRHIERPPVGGWPARARALDHLTVRDATEADGAGLVAVRRVAWTTVTRSGWEWTAMFTC